MSGIFWFQQFAFTPIPGLDMHVILGEFYILCFNFFTGWILLSTLGKIKLIEPFFWTC